MSSSLSASFYGSSKLAQEQQQAITYISSIEILWPSVEQCRSNPLLILDGYIGLFILAVHYCIKLVFMKTVKKLQFTCEQIIVFNFGQMWMNGDAPFFLHRSKDSFIEHQTVSSVFFLSSPATVDWISPMFNYCAIHDVRIWCTKLGSQKTILLFIDVLHNQTQIACKAP